MSEMPAKTAVNSEQTSRGSWFSLQLEYQITLAQASVSLKWISLASPGLHLEPFIPLCPELSSSPARQFLSWSVKIPNFLALAAVNFSKPCLLQCWTPTASASWGFIILTPYTSASPSALNLLASEAQGFDCLLNCSVSNTCLSSCCTAFTPSVCNSTSWGVH